MLSARMYAQRMKTGESGVHPKDGKDELLLGQGFQTDQSNVISFENIGEVSGRLYEGCGLC